MLSRDAILDLLPGAVASAQPVSPSRAIVASHPMVRANILARVGGEHVAAALNTLPDPAVDTEERRGTVIEVPGLGQVRFTCKRFVSRKGKLEVAERIWGG
jgi:hypothetical protein